MTTIVPTLPTAPNRSMEPDVFIPTADTWQAAIPPWTVAVNALAVELMTANEEAVASAAAAFASEALASASALAAASYASAPGWVTGSTYPLNYVVYAPADNRLYRKKTASSVSTVDPSADNINWNLVSIGGLQYVVSTLAATAMFAGQHLSMQNAAQSHGTLPAVLNIGEKLSISSTNGRFDNYVAANGHKIMGLLEDLTIGDPDETVDLLYEGGSIGVRILNV